MPKLIHIIEDDRAIQSSLRLMFMQWGFEFECFDSPLLYEKGKKANPDLIMLDLNFSNNTSGEEGIAYLKQLKMMFPEVPVILITAWGTISLAVEGIKNGAFDFVTKPWDNDSLLKVIETALELNASQTLVSRNELDENYDFSNIIGVSSEITEILQTIARIAKTNAPVLILGESGTGKELIAEAIHNNSQRISENLVKVNLGGIPSNLFESEMFGHKKGAFTDAHSDREGRFELANNGTIFLDEIGDLDLNSQVKLLRVLQDKSFQRLGESKTQKSDVRVVCATNKNLSQMIDEGSFREDLLYRINLITIKLPALRERKEDLKPLVNHFIEGVKTNYGVKDLRFADSAFNLLETLPLQGNIRELKNLVERSYLVTGNSEIKAKDIKAILELDNKLEDKKESRIDEVEKQMIESALSNYKNNISKTASYLGLSRAALYRRMEKYSIKY
jgi:two-component system NtrC family response regulator